MKTSISEKKFSKIKKFHIKSKDIELEKKMMNNKTKPKKKNCNELYICEIKYD